jgi:hypothetical protein
MKWKSSNVFYLIGIGLPLTVMGALGIKIAWPSVWGCAAIFAATVLLLKMLIRKVRFLPRPLAEYGELKRETLELPGDPEVEVYSSNALCQYDFVLRIAEFLSPFSFADRPPKVVINPRLLQEKGTRFMQIAVMREIERYRRKHQTTAILHLLLPLFALAIAALSVFAFKIPLSDYLGPFWVQFAMPFLFTIFLGLHLFLWNKSLSVRDYQLDLFLTSLFTVADVKQYILSVEKLEGGNETKKQGAFNHYYTNLRLKQLEKVKKSK